MVKVFFYIKEIFLEDMYFLINVDFMDLNVRIIFFIFEGMKKNLILKVNNKLLKIYNLCYLIISIINYY